MHFIDNLLKPGSIAVVGASREKQKLGRMVLDNIVKSGFKGKIYPINPKAKRIAGFTCHPTVSAVRQKIDLVVISIPASFVLDVVKDCVKKSVGAVIVIASGFSETGKDGLEQELKLKEVLAKKNIPLLGPNCLGIINTSAHINATFAKPTINAGNIAFLSQSGALGTAALDWAQKVGIGFSHFVSLGNKLDLSENNFIEYLNADKNVGVIGMYLEDFTDGKKFMELARTSSKPIIVLKPGKSKAAQHALGSHTGSMAQNDLIISAALEQSGVIQVETIEELFYTLMFFSWHKGEIGNKIAVITNAGGPGVVTTDEIEIKGLKLARLKSSTKKRLALTLPSSANCNNPIDVLGDALADRYAFALKTVLADRNVDAVMVLLTPQTMTDIVGTAKEIVKVTKTSKKLLISCFLGGRDVEKGREIISTSLIPGVAFPSDAVDALTNLYRYYQGKKRLSKRSSSVKSSKYAKKVNSLLEGVHGVVDTQLAERILKFYKIPLLRSHFPKDIADARRGADKVTYPIVLKLIHPKLVHKTDVKAVKLNVMNNKQLVQSYNELSLLAQRLKLEGYKMEIQPFITGTLELIIGVKYDEDTEIQVGHAKTIVKSRGFGHSLLFGMGGIYTEVFKDVSLKMIPLVDDDITDILNNTYAGIILKGERGVNYNVKKVRDVIKKINQLVHDISNLRELDINPLFACGKDVWVVDVKMFVA